MTPGPEEQSLRFHQLWLSPIETREAGVRVLDEVGRDDGLRPGVERTENPTNYCRIYHAAKEATPWTSVGCAAGEGHLDGGEMVQSATAELLAGSLRRVARELNCVMVVLKEFPAKYRAALQPLQRAGFTRVPSMPMTTLGIEFRNFEDYVDKTLSPRTRGKVRRSCAPPSVRSRRSS